MNNAVPSTLVPPTSAHLLTTANRGPEPGTMVGNTPGPVDR